MELSIPVLAASWTDAMGDAELFAAMDRENRERADLSPYEQGMMYQRALEEGLFPSQRQLAEKLGVTHTWVRKAIMVAQLPPAIAECFRSPLEIQHRMAEVISAALEKDGRAVLRRAEKLRGQNFAPSAVVEALLGAARGRREEFNLQVQGKSVGKCVREPDGGVKISLSRGSITDESIESLVEVLRGMRR